jgi:hypothetical protein
MAACPLEGPVGQNARIYLANAATSQINYPENQEFFHDI